MKKRRHQSYEKIKYRAFLITIQDACHKINTRMYRIIQQSSTQDTTRTLTKNIKEERVRSARSSYTLTRRKHLHSNIANLKCITNKKTHSLSVVIDSNIFNCKKQQEDSPWLCQSDAIGKWRCNRNNSNSFKPKDHQRVHSREDHLNSNK